VLTIIFLVACLSGIMAAVSGFGIGSLLTPLLSIQMGMSTAVAAVALPHAIATALRWWRLRAHVDSRVVRSFGILSAVGGLAGALLYARPGGRTLTIVLGMLLLLTALAGITEWTSRVRVSGPVSATMGFLSGFFGGVAGNQGGLRSGALMSFALSPRAFVATATATALMVDAARTPVYLYRAGPTLLTLATPIAVATLGVLAGTLIGERILFGLSPARFRRIVCALIGAIGVWLIVRA
jgi:uncharacterized membrane protein YfcA